MLSYAALMKKPILYLESLTESAIGAFYEVYRELGDGFLESVYMNALTHELRLRGHHVERQVRVQIWYKGVVVGRGRIDMLVDKKLVIETKAAEELHPSASRQLRNYLRATDLEVGLVLNFGIVPRLRRVEARNRHRRKSPLSSSSPSSHQK